MAVYALGDLHFSPNNSKPMDVFGWGNHKDKIIKSWNENVKEDDIVILAGDISWALKFDEAFENLDEIDKLKGKKIIIKGNHDYWWQSISKMNNKYPNIFFIHNNFYSDDKYLIFGTRGWDVPGSFNFKESDERIYLREVQRLKNSINGFDKKNYNNQIKIVVMHYPPINENRDNNEILDLMYLENISHFIYGHLHGDDAFKNILNEEHNGTIYHLVSADYLNFKLKKILD